MSQAEYVTRVHFDKFLNLPGMHQGAYIRVYVEDSTDRSTDRYFSPRTILEIADCDKRVSFDMDWSEFGMKNNLHKVDTLIAGLRAFRSGLVAEHKLQKERLKNRPASDF